MSPWLDPGRRLDETVAAWEEAASSSVDYLRGVKDSMEAVERLVFGDETDETESSPPSVSSTRICGRARSRHATLPPVLVQCGGAEVLAGESRAFGAAAMDAGWSDVGAGVGGHAARVSGFRRSRERGEEAVGPRGRSRRGSRRDESVETGRWRGGSVHRSRRGRRRSSRACGDERRRVEPRAAVDDEIDEIDLLYVPSRIRCHRERARSIGTQPRHLPRKSRDRIESFQRRRGPRVAPRRARRRDSTAHAARRSRVFRRRRKEAEPQSRDGRARERPVGGDVRADVDVDVDANHTTTCPRPRWWEA